MDELSIPLPEDMKAPLVQQMLATFWVSTVLGFMKTAGTEESMEIMGPMMENIGVAKAQSMMKVIPKLEENALGFAAWTNTWEELLGIEGHIAESSPERVVKIITKCPLADEGVSPVMCDLLACSLKGAGSVISPDFFFFNTHMKTRGDDKCRWVIERKK